MKSLSRKMFWWFAHSARKARCGRLFYSCMKPFAGRGGAEEAKPLETFWPDRGESCICINEISPEPNYDLQIIVPAYNVADYVGECLDSILSQQTHFSFKVVVVNDGSTDGTAEVLRQYEDRDCVLIITQANRGLSGARNTALLDVDARYVTFVDSDDMLCPGAVEAWMEKAVRLDADIVEGGFERFDSRGVISSSPHIDSDDDRSLSGFAWGKVYKADLFGRVHFPEGYWFEDSVCCAILHPCADLIATVPGIQYRWRRNEQSITSLSKVSPRCIESYWVMKKMVEDRRRLGLVMTDEVAYYFLWQVTVNYRRVARLYDVEIDRSLFAETCSLFADNFSPEDFERFDSPVAEAVFNRDYVSYVLACAFL